MIIWLDAQLPPSAASWITATFGIAAHAVRDLGLHDAKDPAIFQAARDADAVVITKDSDLVELVRRLGAPPKVIWLTCGNTSNARLRVVSPFEDFCSRPLRGRPGSKTPATANRDTTRLRDLLSRELPAAISRLEGGEDLVQIENPS